MPKNRYIREFNVGEHVYLTVKPRKHTLRTVTSTKLAPQICGLCKTLDIIGPVAYQLALCSHIRVDNAFHVYFLNKYVHDSSHIIDWKMLQVEPEG